jgi:hypothetical protein
MKYGKEKGVNPEMKGGDLWKQTTANRQNYIDRAREASLLTLPQIYPPEGSDSNTKYPTPYQSVGGKGVNNLANKIVLSLFPPSQAFFKLGLSPADLAATGKSEGSVKEAMYVLERAIVNEMELSSLRPKLVLALKQGIIGGSFVMYIPDDGAPEIFHLNEIGIKRDKQGNVLKLVLKQEVMYQSLASNIQKQLKDVSEDCQQGKKPLEMYTCIIKKGKMYQVWQEIKDTKIEGTDGTFLKKDLPYIFVPFVDNGEDYGRSYIEDFIGDLQSYEGLRQSLLEGAAESARILYLLNPNSVLSLKKLQAARSGDVLLGNREDVQVLQADKSLDMSVTQKEADSLRQELAITFLLDSAVRRNAERVTAEEIRTVSQELEVSLGGIYSTMSVTLQAPLVRLYMNRLVKKKKLSEVLKNSTELEITTGSAALGRGTDFQTLTTFVATLTQIMQAQGAGSYIDMPELIKRLAYSLDINTAQLVKTQEQIAQEQQAAAEAQAVQEAAPEVIAQNNEAQLQQE